mgnify:CR=1 FL=1
MPNSIYNEVFLNKHLLDDLFYTFMHIYDLI